MSTPHLRAWWSSRQGLSGSREFTSPADALEAAGWVRTVGGANPYLALHARGGFTRETVDAALADGEIHELPSARGCTYLIPRSEYALALTVSQGFAESAAIATAKKYLGVTDSELDTLMTSVVDALGAGPLDPRELRTALGDTVRNLGAEGKKRGQTTTLPLALGRLQSFGEIRRIPTDGRLDQERYRYARWDSSPLSGVRLDRDAAFVELARRFFDWIGPAAPAHFQWFSGLGVGATKKTLAELDLVPIEPESPLLIQQADLDAFRNFRPYEAPEYAFVGSMDGLIHLRRDLAATIDPEDRDRPVLGEKTVTCAGGLSDLPSHGIFDRGRLVGLWEFDPDAAQIEWHSFTDPDPAFNSCLERARAFVAGDLGDARSFSLDSPAGRRPRLSALRQLRTGN